jgi:transposase-like protein
MAQILDVHCRACGADETQVDGTVFAGYRPRCEECGHARLVPWDSDGRPADQGQDALKTWISEQAGACSCGGRFSSAAPVRCGECRSTDVSTTFAGTAD